MAQVLGIVDLNDIKQVWQPPYDVEQVKFISRTRSSDNTTVVMVGEQGQQISFKVSDLNLLEYALWNKKYDAFNILCHRFHVNLFNSFRLLQLAVMCDDQHCLTQILRYFVVPFDLIRLVNYSLEVRKYKHLKTILISNTARLYF